MNVVWINVAYMFALNACLTPVPYQSLKKSANPGAVLFLCFLHYGTSLKPIQSRRDHSAYTLVETWLSNALFPALYTSTFFHSIVQLTCGKPYRCLLVVSFCAFLWFCALKYSFSSTCILDFFSSAKNIFYRGLIYHNRTFNP